MRKIDLSGCLSFVQKQLGLSGVARLHVSGTCRLIRTRGRLRPGDGPDRDDPDTPKMLSVKSADWAGMPPSAHRRSRRRTPAGAEPGRRRPRDARGAPDRRISSSPRRRGADPRGSGTVQDGDLRLHAQELHRYQKKLDPAALAFAAAAAGDRWAAQGHDAPARTAARGRREQPALKISEVLKEIIDAMPDKLWLDHLSIANDLVSNKPFDVVLAATSRISRSRRSRRSPSISKKV